MLRFLTAGESHGPGLVAVVEGLPKGLEISVDDISVELTRRRRGYGRGKRMAIEQDEVEFLGGVRHGRTLGSPVAVLIRNTEWPNWSEVMSAQPGGAGNPVTRPRPGHADLAGMIKYETDDARDILERASARETAARTVPGALGKRLLAETGVGVLSHVVAIGGIESSTMMPGPHDLETVDSSEVRCFDPEASQRMIKAIDEAGEAKDTLGGVVEAVAFGVPVGLGSHVHYDRRLDALLAGSMMSIPAIKGIEVGDGFAVAGRRGSVSHDEIVRLDGRLDRETNRAGGIEGGISNGQPVRVRLAMKPISTLMQPLKTVDMDTGEDARAVRERSDICAAPAAGVVAEQVMAATLAAEVQRKFGGDTMRELVERVAAHRSMVEARTGR